MVENVKEKHNIRGKRKKKKRRKGNTENKTLGYNTVF